MTTNDRVTELEFQLTHVQRNYEQLNEVVIEQAKEIHRLTQRFSKLAGELDELKNQPTKPVDPQDEKPPHYLIELNLGNIGRLAVFS